MERSGAEIDGRFEQMWGGQLALCNNSLQGVMMGAL